MTEPQRYEIKIHDKTGSIHVRADSIVYHGDRLVVFILGGVAQIGVSVYNLDYYKKV